MAALEASVAAAKDARKRHPTGRDADEDGAGAPSGPRPPKKAAANARRRPRPRRPRPRRPASSRSAAGSPRRSPAWLTVVEIDGRQLKLTQPRQGPVPRDRVHQGRGHRLLRPHRAGDAPAPRRPLRHLQALPQRGRRQVLLREALPVAPPRVGAASASGPVTAAAASTTACSTTRRRLVWAAQPRRPRAAHADVVRAPTSTTPNMVVFDLDPGPPAGDDRVRRGRPRPPRRARRPRARDLRQDVGLEGPAALPAAQHPAHHRAGPLVRPGRRPGDGEAPPRPRRSRT